MVLMLEEVDSTNSYARERYGELPDGALIVARRQTAGRGRRGRVWVSPAGTNFTGSVLFKGLGDAFHAGCLLGLSALSLLRELAPELPVYLKWPNDLYVEDRKLAGILCESAQIENGRITAVVAGMGLNINLSPEELRTIDQPATSLLAETGRHYDLDEFAQSMARHLKRHRTAYQADAAATIREWIAANLLLGEALTLQDAAGVEYYGVFRDILPDGGMLFEENGTSFEFTCGDVKINRDSIDWDVVKEKSRKIRLGS